MTNNTKPIIEKKYTIDNHVHEYERRPEDIGETCKHCWLLRSTIEHLSTKSSTNDKQLSENWIDDIDELIQSELIYSRGGQVVGIRSTLLRDKMIEYFTPQIATAVQEERKRITEEVEGKRKVNYPKGHTAYDSYNVAIDDVLKAITDKE